MASIHHTGSVRSSRSAAAQGRIGAAAQAGIGAAAQARISAAAQAGIEPGAPLRAAIERHVLPRLLALHAATPSGTTPRAVPGATPSVASGAVPNAAPGALPSAAPSAAPGALPGAMSGTTPAATPHSPSWPASWPASAATAASGTPDLSARLSVELALDAVGPHPEKVAARLERLLDGGADPVALCLDVLAPAARHLGHLWVEDALDFVDVTLGTMRLERALRGALSPAAGARPATTTATATTAAGRAPTILMLPLPGNQHTFGLSMAADFFRRAGWTVSDAVAIPPGAGSAGAAADGLDGLERHLRGRALDAIGIAVSCETQTARLVRALAMIRAASRNPRIRIVLGGPLFSVQPGLRSRFDADLVVTDASRAPVELAALLPDPEARRGGADGGRPEGSRPEGSRPA